MKGVNTGWTPERWNETYFPAKDLDGDGDIWGMRWRGMEKMRYHSYLEILREHLRGPHPLDILDIGCALCDFTIRAWKLNPENNFSCVDISTNAVDWGTQKYPQFTFQQGALPDIPFDKDFDMIFCLEVLVHLDSEDRQKAIDNMHRQLAPGGKLFFSGMLSIAEHHTEEEVSNFFAQNFDVVHTHYNYWMLHQKSIEFPLQKLSPVIERMLELLSLSRGDFNEIVASKNGGAKFAVIKLLRLLNPLSSGLLRLVAWIIRRIRGSKLLATLFSKIQKLSSGGKNPDEIVILAAKQ